VSGSWNKLVQGKGEGSETNLEDDTIKATTSDKNRKIMLSGPKQTKKYNWYRRNATPNWSLMKAVYYKRTATGKYTATVQQLLENNSIENDEEDRITEPASDDMVSAEEDRADLEELENTKGSFSLRHKRTIVCVFRTGTSFIPWHCLLSTKNYKSNSSDTLFLFIRLFKESRERGKQKIG